MKLSQLVRNVRFHIFYTLFLRRGFGLARLGGECAWSIHPDHLDSRSHVLCAGAGHDISFELECIRRFGCDVTLLDPSPTGAATVSHQAAANPKLRFLPDALTESDGEAHFAPPADAEEGSFRQVSNSGTAAYRYPSRSIQSLMREFGWNRLDLLKIDIEGSEYEVLQQVIGDQIDVRQICVEFHHGAGFSASRLDTMRTIFDLHRAGFRLIHHVHWDHTFIASARLE